MLVNQKKEEQKQNQTKVHTHLGRELTFRWMMQHAAYGAFKKILCRIQALIDAKVLKITILDLTD